MTKNLNTKAGFKNRHLEPLPDKPAVIEIVFTETNQEKIALCNWNPFHLEEWKKGFTIPPDKSPAPGFIGTAEVIQGTYPGIGFHAWEQNNSEFVFYNIVSITEFEKIHETESNWKQELAKINNCQQRQDSTNDQLRDLALFANKLGFYDAADYLKRRFT